MTQEQLAENMMLPTSEIEKWESGIALPEVDSFRLLAELLHVSMDDLLNDGGAADVQIIHEPGEAATESRQASLSQNTVRLPQQSRSPGFVQVQSPYGCSCLQQTLPARSRQRIHADGKRCFSARTVVYPIVFLVLHFLIQLLGAVIAGISYINSDSFASLVDATPDTSLDLIQELARAIGTPALLYSAPLQIIIYVIFLWYQKRKNRKYLLLRPAHATAFPLGLATAFGCLGITTLLLQLFDMLAMHSSFWQDMMATYQRSTAVLQGVDLLLLTLGAVILVPLAEELLFRGIITEEIRQVAPDWLAVLLGGVIFALVHGNLIQILYVLPLGLLLGAVYIWSSSVWVPVLIHVVYNFFGSVFDTQIGGNETVRTIYTVFLYIMIPAGILCALFMNRTYRKDNIAVGRQNR